MLSRLIIRILHWRASRNPGDRTFKRISELISLIPGSMGSRLRTNFYARTLTKCAENVQFGFGMILNYRDIQIGQNVSFGRHCSLGMADFDADVLVSGYCHFLSGGRIHDFSDPVRPIREQGVSHQRIRIGRGAWVGAGAIVMADIGEGAVVGAGSVVTRQVLPFQVVAGNPARVLRTREGAPVVLET